MRILLALVAIPLLSAAVCFGSDAGTVIEKAKQSVVMVRVAPAVGNASGFLWRKEGTTGYIVTAAHVFAQGPGPTAELTFHCGTAADTTVEGLVIATDIVRDLAILKVESSCMPKTIACADLDVLAVGRVCFVLGFPLTKPASRPRVVATECTWLGVEEHTLGTFMKLRGRTFPGNSGSAVVDPDGKLIGVEVRGDARNDFAYAIPAADIDNLFARRVDTATILETGYTPGTAKLQFNLPLSGFEGTPVSVSLLPEAVALINPATGTRIANRTEGTYRWPPMKTNSFPVSNGAATGELTLTGDSRMDADFIFHVRVTFKDGSEQLAGFFRGRVHFSRGSDEEPAKKKRKRRRD